MGVCFPKLKTRIQDYILVLVGVVHLVMERQIVFKITE